MAQDEHGRRLQVLIANEHRPRLAELEAIVRSMGHDVIVRETDPGDVATLTREHQPEVALVGLGDSDEHALSLIKRIAHESTCPVILVLHEPNPGFVAQAARYGVFAAVSHDDPEEYRSAIEIALERFASFRNLEGAFSRRARIERAKGILMERHGLGEQEAFELLRGHARRQGRKLGDVAAAVTGSHSLLPAITTVQPDTNDRPTADRRADLEREDPA